MILAGVMLFVATVTALHTLQPAYDPFHQLMSELALGPSGWAMIIAFVGLALAFLGIDAALYRLGASPLLMVLLLAAAVAFFVAGIFPLGAASEIHIAAIALAFVLSVLAMYLYPAAGNRAAAAAPKSISWSLAGGVALSVLLGHLVLPMGVGQRLAALCLVGWLGVIGWTFLSRRRLP